MRRAIRAMGLRQVAQVVRVNVTSVNKDAGTFTGSVDGEPDYEDIHCGMGSVMVYPAVGSVALIVHVSNTETDSYLLDCEEIEEMVFDGGTNLGMVKVESLVERLNGIEGAFNDLLNCVLTHTHTYLVPPATTPIPTSTPLPPPTVQPITPVTNIKDLENERVKH